MLNRLLWVLVENELLPGEARSAATAGTTTTSSSGPLLSNRISFSLYITGPSEMNVRKTSFRITFGENRMVESECALGTRLAENVWKISPICSVNICMLVNYEFMCGENALGTSPPSMGGCR